MRRDDIEKAATQHANMIGWDHDPEETRGLFTYSFEKGAEWRINSVWHKPSDIAEPGKDCLVEHMDIDGNVCICIDWRSEYEWVKSCYYNKILRWAYIKDLLP